MKQNDTILAGGDDEIWDFGMLDTGREGLCRRAFFWAGAVLSLDCGSDLVRCDGVRLHGHDIFGHLIVLSCERVIRWKYAFFVEPSPSVICCEKERRNGGEGVK